MSKVYCRDCVNYHTEELTSRKIVFERCKIVVDDYCSPTHLVERSPELLNSNNACLYYESKKSGKKEEKK